MAALFSRMGSGNVCSIGSLHLHGQFFLTYVTVLGRDVYMWNTSFLITLYYLFFFCRWFVNDAPALEEHLIVYEPTNDEDSGVEQDLMKHEKHRANDVNATKLKSISMGLSFTVAREHFPEGEIRLKWVLRHIKAWICRSQRCISLR